MFSEVRGNHEKQGSLACMAENGCLGMCETWQNFIGKLRQTT
jgi:hypothetical protein